MLEKFGLLPATTAMARQGQKFGRLEVLMTGVKGRYRYYAVCRCDCGTEKCVRADHLAKGSVISCGCAHRDAVTSHSLTHSEHYGRWKNMLDRCENPKCKSFPFYGGRGIKVCDRWRDMRAFVDDLPDGYFEGAQIDRIDNNGNYEPGNIRWATPEANCSNRRSTRLLTHNGETLSATEWSARLGGGPSLVLSRIDEFGWSVEDAVNRPILSQSEIGQRASEKRWAGHLKKPSPPRRVIKTVEYNGSQYTANEIAEMAGKPVKLVRKQLYERGWSVDKVLNNK
ncbi:hypothetical protein HV350_07930 [Citrobacter sp. RHBSTW-01013]|uniref:hypothetical protein n=1 Tax=Citrobacter sp. RHBSTW-01013 TaxID=2742677 RepID=UPI0015E9B508|nr:hypothetical protein [Citrobacter sp. RHBSTW-01013]QLR23339.1 hypothetical protein HV350_07930 [Citrobacter sp. RHBSTW-01013]